MYEAHLRSLLSPLGIYDLEEHSASGAAVCSLGTGLDTVSRRLEEIEREALTATAEGEGLARREALLAQREAQLEKEQAAFDIHDRVNYAVVESSAKLTDDKKAILLCVTIDTENLNILVDEKLDINITYVPMGHVREMNLTFAVENPYSAS